MKTATLVPSHAFQFRLGTLLLAILWVAIVCMGLRTGSESWWTITYLIATGAMLLAALMSIYRTGRTRAFALGFLIVGGYYGMMSSGEHNYDDPSTARPDLVTTRGAIALYSRIHGDSVQATFQTVNAPAGSFPAIPASAYQIVEQPVAIAPGAIIQPAGTTIPPPATLAPTPLPYVPPQLAITPVPMSVFTRTIRTPTVSLSAFLSVAHNSLLMLVGLIGGITAQYLHATRRDESAEENLTQRRRGAEQTVG